MLKVPAKPSSSGPIGSRWHTGPVSGAPFDAELNWDLGNELLGWIRRGIDLTVTGQDATRVFLAQRKAPTEVIDPIRARKRTAA